VQSRCEQLAERGATLDAECGQHIYLAYRDDVQVVSSEMLEAGKLDGVCLGSSFNLGPHHHHDLRPWSILLLASSPLCTLLTRRYLPHSSSLRLPLPPPPPFPASLRSCSRLVPLRSRPTHSRDSPRPPRSNHPLTSV
jgi:hypothetical protein